MAFTPDAPVLILGSSGFLGWNLLDTAPEGFKVLAHHHNNHLIYRNPFGHISPLCLDLSQQDTVELIGSMELSGIIYAAALADIQLCKDHPDTSWQINHHMPLALAKLCAARDLSFLYYSTDLVFDGKAAPYDEAMSNCPLSLYGEQKAKTEMALLSRCPNACIFRLPLLYGEAPAHVKTALRSICQQLKQDQTLNLFNDEFRSPVRARRVAEFSWAKLGQLKGLYNLGGPERLSRFEMGRIIATSFGYNTTHLKATSQSDFSHLGPRPKDCSLNSTKAFRAGFRALPMAQELGMIAKDYSHLLD